MQQESWSESSLGSVEMHVLHLALRAGEAGPGSLGRRYLDVYVDTRGVASGLDYPQAVARSIHHSRHGGQTITFGLADCISSDRLCVPRSRWNRGGKADK